MKSSRVSFKKKSSVHVIPRVEINGKIKIAKCKTKEGRYCTLAENLFHREIHCFPGSDHRSHFSLKLGALRSYEGCNLLAEWPRVHQKW